jgi:hypothetical protein
MTYSLTSPVTGSAQTGLTTPTYTHVTDTAPDSNGKQNAVTALGGTQTGVTVHSVSSPFTATFFRPKVLKVLGPAQSNGFIPNVPKNDYRLLIRKGVTPAVNQPAQVMVIDCRISVPAGSDTYDVANVRAALSMAIGALTQQSAGIGDTAVSGVM